MNQQKRTQLTGIVMMLVICMNMLSSMAFIDGDVWADFAAEKNIARIKVTKDEMYAKNDENGRMIDWEYEITFRVLEVVKGTVMPSKLTQVVDRSVGTGETYAAFDDDGNITNIAMIRDKDLMLSGDNGIGPKTIAEAGSYLKKPYKLAERVMAANNTSFAIDFDENLYAWGDNSYGQLGVGDTKHRNTPTLIKLPENKSTTIEALGKTCTFVSTWDGETSQFYAWGQNTNGQLGLGDTRDRTKPALVPLKGEVKTLALGKNFAIAIMHDGNVYAWGDNQYGQLGLGDNKTRLRPTRIAKFSEKNWIRYAYCGDDYVLALGSLGEVYTWGRNDKGQLGTGDNKDRNKPVQIVEGTDKRIEVGETKRYVCEVRVDGASSYMIYTDLTLISSNGCEELVDSKYQLYGWGENNRGQLGLGDTKNRNKPHLILEDISSVSMGNQSVYVNIAEEIYNEKDEWIDTKNSVLAFGDNTNQKLLCGEKFAKEPYINTPTLIENVCSVYRAEVGEGFILFKTGTHWRENEDILSFGLNKYGQLGDKAKRVGNTDQYQDKVTESFGYAAENIREFAVGDNHVLILAEDGKIYSRGKGTEGQLGNGKTQNASQPQLVVLPYPNQTPE